VPYLDALGVSHLYASPLLRARAGSGHGYDVVDPTAIDPARGSEEALAALVGALRARGQGLVLDIVPNHMAASAENPFWEDVLAHGPGSPYARWFDVDWTSRAGIPAPVLLPVLGDVRARVLARGELGVALAGGALRVRYFEQGFPLDPATLPLLLEPVLAAPGVEDDVRAALAGLLATLRALPPWRARAATAAGWRVVADDGVARLARLLREAPRLRAAVHAWLDGLAHGSPGQARLRAVLDAQPYRLVYWGRAADEISYRRFFNVSDLIGVRVEDADVFAATHARLLAWAAADRLDGVRVDHVDGLLAPGAYLARLRAALATAAPGRTLTVHVEKILSGDERLPASWPVAGTTGYEFATAVDAVLFDPGGAGALAGWYRRAIGGRGGFRAAARAGKRQVLRTWLAADARRLGRGLAAVLRGEGRPGPGVAALVRALVEVMVHFPVYRTYVEPDAPVPSAADRDAIARALAGARRAARAPAAALDAVAAVLAEPGASAARLAFVQRFQQTTGPVMAKGVEDTALYRWVPLAARNEVGSEPDAPLADAAPRLHAWLAARAARWPQALSTVTTHDTKRSADVRARLAVLSERPAAWIARVERWRRRHRALARDVDGRRAPDAALEYLIYQTLVGVWPLGPVDRDALAARVRGYVRKAAREAKVHTSWLRPHPAFEEAVDAFVAALLADEGFVADVAAAAGDIARPGLWNALARTLVHLTAPGVPDVYQGDETWCFTLTDPDNRRPVDFAAHAAMLAGLAARPVDEALAAELVAHVEDGRAKLHVVRTALALRRTAPALFAGAYDALATTGTSAGRVFAFARRAGGRMAVTIVPRLVASLGGSPVGDVWGDTACTLPAGTARLVNALTGAAVAPEAGGVAVARALAAFPVALLVGDAGA
jgi:(1->4)-alpha-D-glucan 1-alpha-D-glucosylmutase